MIKSSVVKETITTGFISTKLVIKHPWVTGIQICSNEEPCPFPKEDNYEIAKIHWRNLKIFSRIIGQYQPNLAQSILGWWGDQFVQMNGHALTRGKIFTKQRKYIDEILKSFSLRITFNQTWQKACLGDGELNLSKWRTILFSQRK